MAEEVEEVVYPRWLDIDRELLSEVIRRLSSYCDQAFASAVCPQWRDVAAVSRLPAPMLMLPNGDAAFVAEYVRLSPICWLWRPARNSTPPRTALPIFLRVFCGGRGYVLGGDDDPLYPRDALNARFCGSYPGRWVALALENWRGYCLLNIDTGERHNLPLLVRIPGAAMDCALLVRSVVLSAIPDSDGAYVAGAMTSGPTGVAFWRPGLDRWFPPIPLHEDEEDEEHEDEEHEEGSTWKGLQLTGTLEDIIFYQGSFYVLNTDEELFAYMQISSLDKESSSADSPFRMVMFTYEFRSYTGEVSRDVIARFLVESNGHLLMIRELEGPEYQFFRLMEDGARSKTVRTARWINCDVRGEALFLGKGCSRSMKTGAPWCVVLHPAPHHSGGWVYYD